jgi:hypothetical protein
MSPRFVNGWNAYLYEWPRYNDSEFNRGWDACKEYCDGAFGVDRRHASIEEINKRAHSLSIRMKLHPELFSNTV